MMSGGCVLFFFLTKEDEALRVIYAVKIQSTTNMQNNVDVN